MTYKWEAIAQDLTEDRDRLKKDAEHSRRAEIAHIGKIAKLLQENERLRKALDEISSYSQSWEYSVRAEHCGRIARAALKSEKQ